MKRVITLILPLSLLMLSACSNDSNNDNAGTNPDLNTGTNAGEQLENNGPGNTNTSTGSLNDTNQAGNNANGGENNTTADAENVTGATNGNSANTEQGASGTSNEEQVNNENKITPIPPTDLKGVVYTDTEIELFWERSTDPTVVAYKVSRDGIEPIQIDALSYYDNTVNAATTYEYSVQSIDNNGNESEIVSVFLTTPEAAPTLNPANAQQVLAHVITAMNGSVFADQLNVVSTAGTIIAGDDAAENGFIETEGYVDDTQNGFFKQFDCEFNGTLSAWYSFNALPSASANFSECETGLFPEYTINGDFSTYRELSKYVYNTGISNDTTIDSLSVTQADGTTSVLSGYYSYFGGVGKSWVFRQTIAPVLDVDGTFTVDENGDVVYESEPMIFSSPAFEGQTRIAVNNIIIRHGTFAGPDSTAESNDFKHSLSAEFTIQSPGTGNKLVSVSTPIEFLRTEGDFFTEGQLLLSAADASSVLLDANTGDPATVQLTTNANGEEIAQTLAWPDAFAKMAELPSQ